MKKCGKVKNPCKICFQTVTAKNGLQCQGVCQKWAHFECLNYTPDKIQDIKAGLIKVICPCPNCDLEPKEFVVKPHICAKELCPANKPLHCETPTSPTNNPNIKTFNVQTSFQCSEDCSSVIVQPGTREKESSQNIEKRTNNKKNEQKEQPQKKISPSCGQQKCFMKNNLPDSEIQNQSPPLSNPIRIPATLPPRSSLPECLSPQKSAEKSPHNETQKSPSPCASPTLLCQTLSTSHTNECSPIPAKDPCSMESLKKTCMKDFISRLKIQTPKNQCCKNKSPKNKCAKNKSPKNECAKNKSPKNECPQNQCPQNQCPQNQCPQNQSPKNQCPKNQSPKPSCTGSPTTLPDQASKLRKSKSDCHGVSSKSDCHKESKCQRSQSDSDMMNLSEARQMLMCALEHMCCAVGKLSSDFKDLFCKMVTAFEKCS